MTSIQIFFDDEENKIIDDYKKLYSLNSKSEAIRFFVYEVYLRRRLDEVRFQLNTEQDKDCAEGMLSSLIKESEEWWGKFVKSEVFKLEYKSIFEKLQKEIGIDIEE